MIVVSNTSPITNLALIGQINLIQHLYGSVHIPQAVTREIAAAIPRLHSGVTNQDWIQVRSVTNHSLVQSLQLEFDDGE